MKRSLVVFGAFLLVAAATGPAAATQDQDWSFTGIAAVDLDGISGSLTVEPSRDSQVHLRLDADVRPAGNFEADVRQERDVLRIDEEWRGRGSGQVHWTLYIPADSALRISMSSASGGLQATGVTAEYEFESASGGVALRDGSVLDSSSFETASGGFDLRNMTVGAHVSMSTASGNFELSEVQAAREFDLATASGNVRIDNSTGVHEGATASGNVRVTGHTLEGPGRFTTASGNVLVRLDQLSGSDLVATSASGDVELEVGDMGSDFTLVVVRRADRGRVDSSLEFQNRRTFERHGRTYEEQTLQRGTGGPEIRLETASGSVRVREGR